MSNITADEYSLLEFISSRDKQEDNSRILLEQTKKILKSLVRKGFGKIEHYSNIGDWFIPDMDAINEFVETHVGQYKLERKYLQYDMFNILEEISRKGYGWNYVSQPQPKPAWNGSATTGASPTSSAVTGISQLELRRVSPSLKT